MRSILTVVMAMLGAIGLASADARAACAGTDLMKMLETGRPEVHADILARGAAVPNGVGRLWEVRWPGAFSSAEPSYLFGTVHSSDAAMRGLSPRADAALEAASLVLVEITPDEQAAMEQRLALNPAALFDPAARPYAQRFGRDRVEMIEEALATRGIAIETAERLRAWVVFSAIAVPLCEQKALNAGGVALDTLIASRAEQAGTPVRGLEGFEEVMDAFAALDQRELNRLLLDSFAGVPHEDDLKATLEGLYHDGQIAAIMEFNIWFSETHLNSTGGRQSAEAIERALIVKRNREWLPTLAQEMRRGGVFAAFGALHLPGEGGIVELMRGRGYEVTLVER